MTDLLLIFTGRMPFLPPNQQRQSTEGKSHTRTVVRECCTGEDQSQWEMGKFDPRHPKTPQPMFTKICVGDYVGESTTMHNFIQIGLGVSVLRMRHFAPLGTK